MRLLIALVLILILGLVAQAVFDSEIGAWIAFGSLAGVLAVKLLGWVGLWPADWPDIFGGSD